MTGAVSSHDGECPLTQVYRVQDAEGRGPYRPGTSYRWVDEDHYRNPPFYVEFGWTVGSIPKRWHIGESGGCAFRSLDDLARWFTSSERSKLEGLGYSIVGMKVDRIIAESRNQLVFARKTPLWSDYLMVPWPSESAPHAPTFVLHKMRRWQVTNTTPRFCDCFGDSGLTASTHDPGDGVRHCDMCGWPIQPGAVDVLTAINALPSDAPETPSLPRPNHSPPGETK